MHVITIASRKGGSGKSTVTAHMGVLGSGPGTPAVLVDLDPQRSLADWWRQRREEFPLLVETEAADLPDILRTAREERVPVVFIDTPPHAEAEIAAAIRVSNVVLIPCRPSAFDLWAAQATLEMAAALERPALVVLNACPAGRTILSGFGENSAVREARTLLQQMGVNVARTALGDRLTYRTAIISGQAASELEPGGKAASEISALWAEITEHLGAPGYDQTALAS
jgi:chromosome partitioning protein